MEILKEAGLTKNEAKVYKALIDLGPSMAGIISRRTGLHRRTVYDTTEMLIKKGLIGYILRNNRRLYQATDPQRIIDLIDQRKNNLLPVIEDLKAKYSTTREKEETNFYKGKKGLKSVFQDQLNSHEILIIGASTKAYEILQFYFNWYDKTRKQRKIKVRIVTHDKKIQNIPLAKIRYLPEKYANPLSINIYDDKTAIILWSSNPLAIVIKNKEITLGYRQYFEILWHIARKG